LNLKRFCKQKKATEKAIDISTPPLRLVAERWMKLRVHYTSSGIFFFDGAERKFLLQVFD
jgi:hypothetical protein